ncbi:MAG: vWA domain-containing protein [bacterium]
MTTPSSRLRTSILVALLAMTNVATAQTPTPLLLEGKNTLYQRVLVKPDSHLSNQAGGKAKSASIAPFSVYYVYEKKQVKGQPWLKVGNDIHGNILGWMPEDALIPWNQGLTVAFRDGQHNDRVMLFRDKKSLEALIKQPDLTEYKKLYQNAVLGNATPDSPVIAIAPKPPADLKDNFYLVPILDFEDTYLRDEQATMLKVATVPQKPSQMSDKQESVKRAAPIEQGSQAKRKKPIEVPASLKTVAEKKHSAANSPTSDFKTGVVFVIDSTLSMGPYIDRTRQAIRNIYKHLANDPRYGDVRFGLVAYRDNPDLAPGLGYLTHTYATLQDGRNEQDFFSKVNKVDAATVSSQDFTEDSFAGIQAALKDINWKSVDGRYVILITDAGARKADDPASHTHLSAADIQQKLQSTGVAATVLHLLTSAGDANHADAKAQYETLSHFPGVGSLYYGVDAGDVDRFGQVLDSITEQISQQVASAQQKQAQASVKMAGATANEALERKPGTDTLKQQTQPGAESGTEESQTEVQEAAKAETPPTTPTSPDNQATDTQLEELTGKIAKVGNALQMQYLQRRQDETIPSVFDAWIIDRDIRKPEVPALEVRVLLTRDQLNDLYEVSRKVLDTFEDGLLSPHNFLADLKSLAATLSRDPSRITSATGAENLASLGVMQEYISDLPYQSSTLNLSSDEWETWNPRQQIDFTHKLEEKVAYYRAVYAHPSLWVSPSGGDIDGNAIFALPLDMLP